MNKYNIAVIPGDGTGPEVVNEALKVLDAAGKKFGFELDKTSFCWGAKRILFSLVMTVGLLFREENRLLSLMRLYHTSITADIVLILFHSSKVSS